MSGVFSFKKNQPAGILREVSWSSAWETGTTTPTVKSISTKGVQKYLELTSCTVTPSFSFTPLGKNRLAKKVFDPEFPLGRNKMDARMLQHQLPRQKEWLLRSTKIHQEPSTRSLQQPHIPVTAFSQTNLFVVWTYLEFRSHSNLTDQL